MKKLFFNFFIVLLAVVQLSAQDNNDPEKAMKTATKGLNAYISDQTNISKLDEAKAAIEIACNNDLTKNNSKTWLTKGLIYSEYLNKDNAMKMINNSAKTQYPDAALIAYNSFKKALELAQKKYEKSDAIKGIADVSNGLRNMGADKYQEKDYASAYSAFSSVVGGQEIMKNAGEKSVLPDSSLNQYTFYAAVCANLAKMAPEAKALYEKLYKAKYKDAAVYDGLYNLTYSEDPKKALGYLEEGRKLFPDETSLLFTEINHYLKINKLDELTSKLKLAIEKEPNNVSLYNTLGNVYDNLALITLDSLKNPEKAAEYSKEALNSYEAALKKQPNNADANYSVGAYYYNRAAAKTKELIKLQDDYSKEGTRKYNAVADEVKALFGQALPYFQKAESFNPNDANTVIALKEIYAKTNDLEKSNEFKKRLENINNGVKNNPYFK